jgi:hypothetical protein
MTTNTMKKAAGQTNSNGQHTDTNGVDFRTDEAIQEAPDGDFIASKYRLAQSCADFAELAVFGRKSAGVVTRSLIQTLGYWLIQSAPYATAILLGVVVGVLA